MHARSYLRVVNSLDINFLVVEKSVLKHTLLRPFVGYIISCTVTSV